MLQAVAPDMCWHAKRKSSHVFMATKKMSQLIICFYKIRKLE